MDPLLNYYNLTATEFSVSVIITNLLLAFFMQIIIVWVYRRTRHGLSYSQSFIFTIVIMGTLSSAVMMIVQNNIVGAFALLGAFALIRFRTIVKETSDIAFIFFALVAGSAVGMGYYSVAFSTVFILSIIILLMNRFAFGSVSDNFDYVLIARADNNLEIKIIDSILDDSAKSRELLHSKYFDDGINEFAYSIKMKDKKDPNEIVKRLREIDSIQKVELLTGKSTSEY